MFVVDMYNAIYRKLANDDVIISLLGLNSSSTKLEKANKIQKRAKPQKIADNIPVISFYSPGGRPGVGNDNVFDSTFVFDIYTSDDVDLAQSIANRITALFDKQFIDTKEVSSFQAIIEDAGESDSNMENTYCFTIVFQMSVGIDS